MAAPLVRPYITYEDLCRLPLDGNRYELYDGEACLRPSPNDWHQEILLRLALLFRHAIRNRSRVAIAPLDVVFEPGTALQPDLLLVLEERLGILQGVVRGTPDLVAEVLSPSTAEMDRGVKMSTYAHYGVGEYWIVDPESEAIEIYRLDREAKAYRLAATCRAGDRASTPLVPDLAIEAGILFRP